MFEQNVEIHSELCPGECCTSPYIFGHLCICVSIQYVYVCNCHVIPRRLLRIMSGETGLSFLSALMSSSSRSWRLRGRGGWGFSLRAATCRDNNTSEPWTAITMETKVRFSQHMSPERTVIASSHLTILLVKVYHFVKNTTT